VIVDGTRALPTLLTPPPSKSDAIRALALTHVLGLPMPRIGDEVPRDVRLTVDGLRELRSEGPREIACHDGGAPFRVLLGQAALRSGETQFFGTARLAERPHEPLIQALVEALGPAGLTVRRESPWPLTIVGIELERFNPPQTTERTFRVPGSESSQFATSLLLAAASLARAKNKPWTVRWSGAKVSEGYLGLTMHWLTVAGFACTREGDELTVSAAGSPLPSADVLGIWPSDWSSAAYLLLVAWRSGGRVAGLDPESPQPDCAILPLLRQIGLVVGFSSDGSAGVGGVARTGLSISAARCPDLVPTLAALASVLPAASEFHDVHLLRSKESDRLAGLLALLDAAGVSASVSGNSLRVEPTTGDPRPFRARTFGDHRLAMSAACLAILLRTSVELDDATCVEKSFPGFFRELRRTCVISW
jgi:3-phosphoshikimate 1-carboxyvinyltransferase